jgi:hypothetical protein
VPEPSATKRNQRVQRPEDASEDLKWPRYHEKYFLS